VTAFYLKRPGQWSSEAETIAGDDDGSWPSDSSATHDEWALSLPHSCGAWDIGIGSREDVLEAAREFRAGLDRAIRRLEQEEAS
jgi:hypothetical protein